MSNSGSNWYISLFRIDKFGEITSIILGEVTLSAVIPGPIEKTIDEQSQQTGDISQKYEPKVFGTLNCNHKF